MRADPPESASAQRPPLEELVAMLQGWLNTVNVKGHAAFEDPGLIAFMRELTTPDFESWSDALMMPSTYHGVEGYLRMQREWTASWRRIRYQLYDTLDTGESILAVVEYEAVGFGSGVEVRQRVAWLFRFEGPKLARFAIYNDVPSALEAVRGEGTA